MSKRVHIVSDGTGAGSTLYIDGQETPQVARVTWELDANDDGIGRAQVEFADVSIDGWAEREG